MAEVLVRHCTIRVVRRGGWSWGPQPRVLLERVLRQLPDIISAELERQFSDTGADYEIVAPIRIAIPLSIAMLRSSDNAGAAARVPADTIDGLAARVTKALRDSLRFASSPDPSPASHQNVGRKIPAAVVPGVPAKEADPLDVLLGWVRRGQFEDRLRGFSVAALRAWHAWIVEAELPLGGVDSARDETIEALLARLSAQWSEPADNEAESLRRRLTMFIAVEAMASGSLSRAAVRAAIDRILPFPAPYRPATAPEVVPPAEKTAPPVQRNPQSVPSQATVRRTLRSAAPSVQARGDTRLEWQIESALPFLLLGPLARVGYLDTAAAVFQAAHAFEDLPLFATALAYKVLSPPARGWLRTPATLATAAAFGLLPEAPPDAALAAMARGISDQTSPLDSVIATVLIEGHRTGSPVLLTKTEPSARLVLFDVDGAFPLATAPTLDLLLPYLQLLLCEIVLVSAAAASPEILAALGAANLCFVTDAPPSRGQTLRAVRGRPGERWWSNNTLHADERLVAAARRLTQSAEDAHAFWQAIGVQRPSLPRISNVSCDSTLTLAAGLGLGSIAWNLWHEREPTSPQLALQRFQDFNARVRVDATSVRVALPLGRRFNDLRDHGFLDDVKGVPWFGGRALCFAPG